MLVRTEPVGPAKPKIKLASIQFLNYHRALFNYGAISHLSIF